MSWAAGCRARGQEFYSPMYLPTEPPACIALRKLRSPRNPQNSLGPHRKCYYNQHLSTTDPEIHLLGWLCACVWVGGSCLKSQDLGSRRLGGHLSVSRWGMGCQHDIMDLVPGTPPMRIRAGVSKYHPGTGYRNLHYSKPLCKVWELLTVNKAVSHHLCLISLFLGWTGKGTISEYTLKTLESVIP